MRLLDRFRFWLGNGAPITASDTIIMFVGLRHHLFSTETGESRACMKVHRSITEWVTCMHDQSRRDFESYLAKYLKKSMEMAVVKPEEAAFEYRKRLDQYDARIAELKDLYKL